MRPSFSHSMNRAKDPNLTPQWQAWAQSFCFQETKERIEKKISEMQEEALRLLGTMDEENIKKAGKLAIKYTQWQATLNEIMSFIRIKTGVKSHA